MAGSTVVVPLSTGRQDERLEQRQLAEVPVSRTNEAYSGGISWGAVIAGGFVSASLALILLALGTGLGLSAVSPWANFGATASTIGKAAIAWFILTQVLAAALGGYLAGRLRTKWVQVHTDEVYFRDTAHGLLVWALGLVVTVSLLASAAISMAGNRSTQRNAGPGASVAPEDSISNPNAYLLDTLFRPVSAGAGSNQAGVNELAQRGEAERIINHAMLQGNLPAGDKSYLAGLVSARTGLSQADSESRVSYVFSEAQESSEKARKALAHLSLWIFVALLGGAFCASYAGTIGGRQRDRVMS